MKDLGPRFDFIERDSSVWRDVKIEMASEGYDYYDLKLKLAFHDLVRKYRNYDAQVMRMSKRGRVDWPLYDDMHGLMKRNVAAEPLLTMTADSAN